MSGGSPDSTSEFHRIRAAAPRIAALLEAPREEGPQSLVPKGRAPRPAGFWKQLAAPETIPGDGPSAIALRAGLFLWHDDLERCHSLAQSIEGEGPNRSGDYWHAIMHRREPDYGNAKYWFRAVGGHPVFPRLAARANEILSSFDAADVGRWRGRVSSSGRWDPFAFVDWCQAAATADAATQRPLVLIQRSEMLLLLEQCLADA